MNKKERSDLIKYFMSRSMLPRNQAASMSGLTNKYISDLEQGKIINVSREKLLSLSIVLNLSINEINKMMRCFDRTYLSNDDIPSFLDVARRIKISNILHPLREEIIYELAILSIENKPGHKLLNSQRLTQALSVHGHRTFKENRTAENRELFCELAEAVRKRRKETIKKQLYQYKSEHFIYKQDLEKYLLHVKNKKEREYRIKLAEEIMMFINTYPNFKYYITSHYRAFTFILKSEEKKRKSYVVFTGREFEASDEASIGRLAAFCTSNINIVNSFSAEIKFLRESINEKYLDTKMLTEYIEQLVSIAKRAN